jgi:hypothetical protein
MSFNTHIQKFPNHYINSLLSYTYYILAEVHPHGLNIFERKPVKFYPKHPRDGQKSKLYGTFLVPLSV